MRRLEDLVDRYKTLANTFGAPVALAHFGFSFEETTSVFNALDEDYHISRFLSFSRVPNAQQYVISGAPVTHVSLDAGIASLI